MNQPPDIIQPSAENLNRRDILKVLAASGSGMLAAAFLPGKWLQPVIEAGVLPAHAMASRCENGEVPILLLDIVSIECDYYDDDKQKYHWSGSADYYDSCCEVGMGTWDYVAWSEDHSIEMDTFSGSGNECEGAIIFDFWANNDIDVFGYIIVNGRMSNQVSYHIICR